MTVLKTLDREGASDQLAKALADVKDARGQVAHWEKAISNAQLNLAAVRKALSNAEQAYGNALFELTGGRQPPTGPAVISVGEAAA